MGPGSRVLDVATGTGDLAIELARRVSPGGEVVGSDFSEGMLGARAREGLGEAAPGAELRFEWADALALPYEDDSFDAATVGFGARNFSETSPRSGGDGPRRAPRRTGGGARDHDPHAPAAVALLSAVVRPHRAALGRLAGSRWRGRTARSRRTPILAQTRSSASRRRRCWRRRWSARALRRSATCSRPGASSRSTRAPCRRRGHDEHGGHPAADRPLGSSAVGRGCGSRRSCAAAALELRERMARTELHLERVTAAAGAPLAAHANATIMAGGKRLRPLLVVLAAESAGGPPRRAPRARSGSCARRSRSSSCTRRRSCTTT